MTATSPTDTRPSIVTEPSLVAATLAKLAQEVSYYRYKKRPPIAAIIYTCAPNGQLHQKGLGIAPQEALVGFDHGFMTQVTHQMVMAEKYHDPRRKQLPFRAWMGAVAIAAACDDSHTYVAQFVAAESRPHVPDYESNLALSVSALLQAKISADWGQVRLSVLPSHLAEDRDGVELPREKLDAMMMDFEWLDTIVGQTLAAARYYLNGAP